MILSFPLQTQPEFSNSRKLDRVRCRTRQNIVPKAAAIDGEGFAHLVNGSIDELAAWVAQSPDPQRLKTAQQLVETLLDRHRVDRLR